MSLCHRPVTAYLVTLCDSIAVMAGPAVGGGTGTRSVYHLVNSSQPVSYEEFFQALKCVKTEMKEMG